MTGFNSKREAAADKQHWNEDEWRRNNWRCSHGWLRGEQCESCNAPQRKWVGLTDEEINALLPEADGAAEVDVKRVEVQPGLWGEECSLADAWSLPLMLQFLNAYEAKLKEKNNGT